MNHALTTSPAPRLDLSAIPWEPLTLRLRLRDRAFLIASGRLNARQKFKMVYESEEAHGWVFFNTDEDGADEILTVCDRLGIRAHLETESGVTE